MITPEEFMAQTDVDEESAEHLEPNGLWLLPPNPLESIAESLRALTSIAVRHDAEEQAADALRQRYDDLDQAYADLEDKHQSLFELLADVEKIVMPSTSKLANSVREAITRWRNPEVPGQPEPTGPPAADAGVEAWREYARTVGITPDEPDALDSMNRSQIRTMLGIEQPAGAKS